MSESSLPPFGSARAFRGLSARARSRGTAVLERLRALTGRGRREKDVDGTTDLEFRAARTVREYLDAQVANLERAERLRERAERLEKEGTPSESARNRAERARGEVAAGLAALRTSFVEAVGREGATRAFDRMVEALCPAFKPGEIPDGGA